MSYTVLIIEDEPSFYDHLLRGCRKVFLDTAQYREPEDILPVLNAMLEGRTLDLVLVDLEIIPGQEPAETTPTIDRILERVGGTPLLVVSKNYTPRLRSRLMDKGVIDLINKNDIIDKVFDFDAICLLLAGKWVKQTWPFAYLETRKIGTTEDVDNIGARGDVLQGFYFFTEEGFYLQLDALILDARICSSYFFVGNRTVALSGNAKASLLSLTKSQEKLLFSELKSRLRESLLATYKSGIAKHVTVDIAGLPKPVTALTLAHRNYQKLEDMVAVCMQKDTAPQKILGFEAEFRRIYAETPDELSPNHKELFRAFIPERIVDTHEKIQPWYENHFQKSLFLAFLPGIASFVLMKLFSFDNLSAISVFIIVFCIVAFLLIKNDPKNKYFRGGMLMIGLIGVVNVLPQFDMAFNIQEKIHNPLWGFVLKLNIQENWYVSIGLFVVACLLFILQFLQEQRK